MADSLNGMVRETMINKVESIKEDLNQIELKQGLDPAYRSIYRKVNSLLDYMQNESKDNP